MPAMLAGAADAEAGESRGGDEQAGGERSADTQAGWDVHRVKVARGRLGLKATTRRLWMSATKSRPIRKGTVMPPGGTPDMSALLAQAQQMQQQLMEAQEALANSEVHGQAGGPLVQVTMKGSGEVVAVAIDPKVVEPSDVETLQDLIVGAIADASKQVTILAHDRLGPLAGGMGGPRSSGAVIVRGTRPGSDRRARQAARYRAEERAADRFSSSCPWSLPTSIG